MGERLLDTICMEMDKIADRGLNTGNLDTAMKLVDMYKDLKCVEKDEMGYSGSRDGRSGRYSGTKYGDYRMNDGDWDTGSYQMYMRSKENYRGAKSNGNKQVLLDSVDRYMEDMSDKLERMMRDADTPEERQTIQKYINKMRA